MSKIGKADLYERVVRPLIFLFDPESAHELAHKALPLLKYICLKAQKPTVTWERLQIDLAGTRIDNPIGLAAGFDKNATLIGCIDSLGFGFSEIGSITGRPSAGNPRPRLFRLVEDRAVINYMGLNGDGAEVVASRLDSGKPFALPLGINIAKTNDPAITGDKAIEDILFSFRCIKHLPLAYAAINVSCPNTHEKESELLTELESLFYELKSENSRPLPLFIKLSPDSDPRLVEEVVSIAKKGCVAGFICGNTSTNRESLKTSRASLDRIGPGGLSGRPLKEKALSLVRSVFAVKDAEQVIIGCGGIESGDDAFEFITAGASAVQLYTALVYRGPFLPVKICRRLDTILETMGVTVSEAQGEAQLLI